VQNEIWITGIGICSSIGLNQDETLSNLEAEKSGLTLLNHLNSRFVNEAIVGEILLSDNELADYSVFKNTPGVHRSLFLADIACREALNQAGLSSLEMNEVMILNGTTTAGMTETEKEYEAFLRNHTTPSSYRARMVDCGCINRSLTEKYGLKFHSMTFSTACSSSSNAIINGANLLRSGKVTRVLAGGVDTLSRFTINGFNSLKNMSLSPCKPFDKDRIGLNLGEGAAYLVMETASSASARGREAMAIYRGGISTNESFHITGSHPEGDGAYHAMKLALEDADLDPADIDNIHAHGTATFDNDQAEGIALKKVFGDHPTFMSTKGYTGHTLAASGALNAVISILGMQKRKYWPNLGFEVIDPAHRLMPVVRSGDMKKPHVLINSFGFGGNNTTFIISNPSGCM